jgi:PAS domain S-box-containing protein/putative nucleotidyltransferase with HDIG domain
MQSALYKEKKHEKKKSDEMHKNKTEVQEPANLSKRAEEALWESEEKYRWVLNNIADLITIMDMNLRFIYVSPAIMRMRGYTAEEAVAQTFEQVMTPESMQISAKVFEEEMRLEASGKADPDRIRIVNIEQYRKDGSIVLMENHLSFMRDEAKKPVGIISVSRDVTERKKAEVKLQQTLDSLKRAVGTTIQVLVSASESKDPYTAGHQKKSADLARAIATEMGLSQDKIEGIRMAGIIHDIGKLSVPAEILSKPSKLTDIEFSLIKEHSRSGYEMLKNVESPWPMAQIVYQHHERMDGSGYPENLKGDEILMDARIMAVADVVEAMASHRPYRAALGIEAALEEIEKNKGILYDDAVVDACLRLFREKSYKLI